MLLRRTVLALLVAASLGACTSDGGGATGPAQSALKQVPAGEVFATAVRDICFGALLEDRSHKAIATSLGFTPTTSVSDKFREAGEDEMYRAEYTSVPVLVAIGDEGARCSVIAVRGEFDAFKKLGEEEIASFSTRYGERADDYLAVVESHPLKAYTLRFTLLSGDNLAGAKEE